MKQLKQTETTKLEEPDHVKLLEAYGNAYANFTSINDRNEKLKPLMTEKCIKNGIDVKTGVALVSVGKVTTIYKMINMNMLYFWIVNKMERRHECYFWLR